MTEENNAVDLEELEDGELQQISGGVSVDENAKPHVPIENLYDQSPCIWEPSQWEPYEGYSAGHGWGVCKGCKYCENRQWKDTFCNRFGC